MVATAIQRFYITAASIGDHAGDEKLVAQAGIDAIQIVVGLLWGLGQVAAQMIPSGEQALETRVLQQELGSRAQQRVGHGGGRPQIQARSD